MPTRSRESPRAVRPSFYDAVWSLVRRVPHGRVVTYGQVATWLGSPRAARAVGYAMFNVSDPGVPWHRVINHKGEISIGGGLHRPELQVALLEAEGVAIDSAGRIDLARHGWSPELDRLGRPLARRELMDAAGEGGRRRRTRGRSRT